MLHPLPFILKTCTNIYNRVDNLVIRRWLNRQYKSIIPSNFKLSKQQIGEIKNLYSPYFKPNLKFHRFYTAHTGNFYPDYIPDDVYYTIIDKYYNDWGKALKFDDKCYYDRLLSNTGFKMPETIVSQINGFWFDSQGSSIDFTQAVSLITTSKQAFFKKSVDSEGGHGVIYYDVNNTDQDLHAIIRALGPDLIVQKPIAQSSTLARLNSSSINTIRFLSFLREDGSVKIYSTILRMGTAGSKVDNASSGGITCGVLPDGRLKDVAYKSDGQRYNCHPDSRTSFSEITIPHFNQIRSKICKAHLQLPNFRLLSWDIALDINDEPILIEVNLKFGQLDFHQLNNGPVFGEDTRQILDEVFARK